MLCPTCKISCSYICPSCHEAVTSDWHYTPEAKEFAKYVAQEQERRMREKIESEKKVTRSYDNNVWYELLSSFSFLFFSLLAIAVISIVLYLLKG